MNDALLQLFWAVVILGAGWFLGGWLSGVAAGWLEDTFDPDLRARAVRVVRPAILVLAAVAALATLGVDITAAAVLLAVAPIAAGGAIAPALSNAAAGAVLLTVRPFRTGDVVALGANKGTVVDTAMFVTTLRCEDGTLLTVANKLVLEGPIRNFGRPKGGA